MLDWAHAGSLAERYAAMVAAAAGMSCPARTADSIFDGCVIMGGLRGKGRPRPRAWPQGATSSLRGTLIIAEQRRNLQRGLGKARGIRRHGRAYRSNPAGELAELVGAAGGGRIDALGVLHRREVVGAAWLDDDRAPRGRQRVEHKELELDAVRLPRPHLAAVRVHGGDLLVRRII